MKVKIKTTIASKDYLWKNGDVVEVDNEYGNRLLKAGFAELVETAVKPAAKKRSTRKKTT